MPDDANVEDRLLDLIYGLLPDEEAAELHARIEKDATLASAYEQARATADLFAEAGRVQAPGIAVTMPEVNGDATREAPRPDAGPEAAPWSGWAHWGIAVAAGLLVAVSLIGWGHRRSQLAGPSDQLRLQVTGPSRILAALDNHYTIATTTLAGKPVSANVHFTVYSPSGDQLLGHTEKTGAQGELRVTVPADPDLPDVVRLEVDAAVGKASHREESRVAVEREPLSTHLALDRARYAPGETVRFRSLTLSRFHLEPGHEMPVELSLTGPRGDVVEGCRLQTDTRRGVAAGEFEIPPDAPGGRYELIARSPGSAFPQARRELRVEGRRVAELQHEVEFAGAGYGPGMEVTGALRVAQRDGTPVAGAGVQLTVKTGEEAIHEEAAAADDDGGVAIRFQLPERLSESARLIATVDVGTLRESFVTPIPLGRGKIDVEFFPEGGELAVVGENRVYFQARDSEGNPVDLTGWIVDEDDRFVASVETVHEGRGLFRLSPRVGVRYRLVASKPEDVEVDGDLPYVVPSQRVVINTGVGVFAPSEPIEFNVRAARAQMPLVAMASCRGVHVGEQAFLTKSVEDAGSRSASNAVSIPLPEDAAGVIRLTVYDYSVSPPRPVAERLVFRRPQRELDVEIASDRKNYCPNDRCRLGLNVTDERGRPIRSMLGVAVADEAALDPVDDGPTTMTSHFWLASEIEGPQDLEDANFLLEENPEAEAALDLLLGTQGWRRFVEREPAELPVAEPEGEGPVRLVADAPPPLMLDNLTALEKELRTGREDRLARSDRLTHVLAALTVLGGSALMVLVIMLSLLRIASGVRIWAPATVAVAISFFLVFLLMNPGRDAVRAVAFQSFRPSVSQEAPLAQALAGARFGDKAASRESRKDENRKESVDFGEAQLGTAPEERESHKEAVEEVEAEERLDESLPASESEERSPVAAEEEPAAKKPSLERMSGEKSDGSAAPLRELNDESGRRPDPAALSYSPDEAGKAETGGLPNPAAEPAAEPVDAMMEVAAPARSLAEDSPTESEELRRRSADAADGLGRQRFYRMYFDYGDVWQRSIDTTARTVFWAPMLETDRDGKALAEFNLSDSVTRFRIVADAHGAGRLGSALGAIVSRLPLQLQPAVPEEVTLGDLVEIPLTIANDSGATEAVEVAIETSAGVRLAGPAEVALSLEDGNRERRYVAVESVAIADEAYVEFQGRAESHRDNVRRTLRVEAPGYRQSETVSGVLDGQTEASLTIPADVVPGSVEAELTVYPRLIADLYSGLESIRGARFESAVAKIAISSRLRRYLEEHDVPDPDSYRLVRQRRSEALQRIAAFRREEGGYSYSEGEAGETDATAEVLLALYSGRELPSQSPEDVGESVTWLRDRSIDGGPSTNTDGDEAPARGALAAEAWRLWALAAAGETGLAADLQRVASRAAEADDPYCAALAVLAARSSGRQGETGGLLEVLSQHQHDDGHVRSTAGSSVETTALAVQAWSGAAGFEKPAEKGVTWLWTARRGRGSFGSARETALALQALVDFGDSQRQTSPESKVIVTRGEDQIGTLSIVGRRRVAQLPGLGPALRVGENRLTLSFDEGSRLPYTLTARFSRQEAPPTDPACPLVLEAELGQSKVSEGDTVRVVIRLKNSLELESGHAVVDLGLPAGLEIASAVLEEMRESGRFSAYESRPRRLTLYLDPLTPEEEIEIAFEASARIPGRFAGPASSVHLDDAPAARSWAAPLKIEIERSR